MSSNDNAIVPYSGGALVATVGRRLNIIDKLLQSRLSELIQCDAFYVPRDGSLELAVNMVQPNGLIVVTKGNYTLESAIVIDKPLRIVGAGSDSSIFTSSVAGNTITVDVDGVFYLEGITIKREQETTGNLLNVTASNVHINSCSFIGNFIPGDDPWAGIWIDGNTSGLIEYVEVTRCRNGIVVHGKSVINLSSNRCVDNSFNGIRFAGQSIVTAENNCSENNGQCGIWVANEASVTLIGNKCTKNKLYGILFESSSTGIQRENRCENNLVRDICHGADIDFSEYNNQTSCLEILMQNIDELELSVSSCRFIKNSGFKIISDLVSKTEEDLITTYGFTRKTVYEIKDLLGEMGLTLGMKLQEQ